MGFDGLLIANLFAYRATDPARLRSVKDPVGEANDHTLRLAAGVAAMILCAWGVHRAGRVRAEQVLHILRGRPLHVFGLTAGGHPRHPLYLPASARPVRWQPQPHPPAGD